MPNGIRCASSALASLCFPHLLLRRLDDILAEHPQSVPSQDSIYRAPGRLAVLDEPVRLPAGKSSVGSVHAETLDDYPHVVALLPAQGQRPGVSQPHQSRNAADVDSAMKAFNSNPSVENAAKLLRARRGS